MVGSTSLSRSLWEHLGKGLASLGAWLVSVPHASPGLLSSAQHAAQAGRGLELACVLSFGRMLEVSFQQ